MIKKFEINKYYITRGQSEYSLLPLGDVHTVRRIIKYVGRGKCVVIATKRDDHDWVASDSRVARTVTLMTDIERGNYTEINNINKFIARHFDIFI